MPHWPTPLMDLPPEQQIARTQMLLDALDNPEQVLPPIVHVAGTNGKGSTIAMLRSMLEAAGYRVHCYTSPHIHQFRERITLAGKMIAPDVLFDCIELTRMAAKDEQVSFFEGTTAAALLAFAQVPADILLLETGLGGRFDPTNVVPEKRLCIITSLSFDHMRVLGNTLEKIAFHKLGILRPHVPAIIAKQPHSLQTFIRKYADSKEAPLFSCGLHWTIGPENERNMRYQDMQGEIRLPTPALIGAHQIQNAGNAIAALRQMPEFSVSAEQMQQGLQQVEHPGRMECLYHPRDANPDIDVWFDGGHNAGGALAISEIIVQWRDKPTYLICGTTRGKQVEDMLAPFAKYISGVFGVGVKAEPNAYDAQVIADAATSLGITSYVSEDVLAAIRTIAQAGNPAHIVVFGSFYLRLELFDIQQLALLEDIIN